MEYIEFDTAPVNEECVQVSKTEDYWGAMCAEATRYKEMLEKRFPDVNGYFTVATAQHDFGSYKEIRFKFEDSEEGWRECNFVENNLPLTWDDNEILSINAEPRKGILQSIVDSRCEYCYCPISADHPYCTNPQCPVYGEPEPD